MAYSVCVYIHTSPVIDHYLIYGTVARRRHGSAPPASRDAGQPLAEAVGREQEEEGRGQRRAEEEAHRVAARLLAPEPQPHVSN